VKVTSGLPRQAERSSRRRLEITEELGGLNGEELGAGLVDRGRCLERVPGRISLHGLIPVLRASGGDGKIAELAGDTFEP